MEEAKGAQPVLDCNKDHIRILFCQIGTVKQLDICSSAGESAAVNPHHYGSPSPCSPRGGESHLIRAPHIQIQAVFTLILNDGLVLARGFGEIISLKDIVTRSNIHRGFPAQFTYRLLPDKRNTLVGNNILRLLTDEGSVDTLYGQRLVIIPIGNRFVLAAEHRFQRLSNLL